MVVDAYSDKELLAIAGEDTDPLQVALNAEGIGGDHPIAQLAKSIYQQESGSGKNTKTSNAGAHGPMQIIPGTFDQHAEDEWDINNPYHSTRAAVRLIGRLNTQYNGDPVKVAMAYYGGSSAVKKAAQGKAVSDPRNPNAPDTFQYAKQVVDRMPKQLIQPNQEQPDYSDEELFKMAGIGGKANLPTHNDISAGTYAGNIVRGVGSEAINKAGNLVNFITQGDSGNSIKQYADSPQQLEQMPGSGIGKFATDVGVNIPAGYAGALVRGAGMLLPWMARAAASALTEGATAEGDNIDRAKAAGWGAAGSAGGDVLGTLLSRLINPALKIHPDAQQLVDAGVPLTPGQMAGPGWLKDAEDKLTSVPFVGGQVAAGRLDSLHGFNKHTVNQALSPIPGARVKPNATPGFNTIDDAYEAISKHYDQQLNGVKLPFSDTELNALKKSTGADADLPLTDFNRFKSTVDKTLHPLYANPGATSGETYKDVISGLNQKIRKFSSSQDPLNHDVADHLLQLKTNLNAHIGTLNNGQFQPMLNGLKQADEAFARMVPVSKAASVQGSPNGVFTPHALYNAVRTTTGNAQRLARGRGFGQIEANAARNVLPSSVPDSGTAGRAMVANLLGGMGLGSATGIGGLTGVATGAGLTALGSRAAQNNIVKPWLFNPSVPRSNVAGIVDNLLRATGAANGERSHQFLTTGR